MHPVSSNLEGLVFFATSQILVLYLKKLFIEEGKNLDLAWTKTTASSFSKARIKQFQEKNANV